MSTIMDIYFSPSLMDMRRKLENAEEEMHQRNSESSQQQNKLQEEQMKLQQENLVAERELKDLMNQRDNETKVYIEELKAQSAFDSEGNEDGIENPLDREKFELDKQKRKDDYVTKMKALDDDMKKHKDNVELKKESNQIARIKKKTTS